MLCNAKICYNGFNASVPTLLVILGLVCILKFIYEYSVTLY